MYPRGLMHGWRCLPALALMMLAALSGCSDGGSVGPGVAEQRLGTSDLRGYRVGVGDKIKLNVFGETDLSGTFEVNAQGAIAVPLVGEVRVKGLDVTGIKTAVAQRLSQGYLKSPRVTAEIAGYRQIYVHGEVRGGGAFNFTVGTRLRDAIAIAGGYTYRANTSYVVLSRDGAAGEVRVRMPNDMLVMPGDNIRVPERYF